MKDKISKNFNPDSCIYRLGRKQYTSSPKNTEIRYYVKEDGVYYAILRRKRYLLQLLAAITCVCAIYVLFVENGESDIIVNVPKTMRLRENKLSLDIKNENNFEIIFSVVVEEEILYSGGVKSNSSLSEVVCNNDIEPGNYYGILEVSCTYRSDNINVAVPIKSVEIKKDTSILLIVE